MKKYSFSTFDVDDANRRAYEICQAVADLKSVAPLPVVLLGEGACGKTHLLYSIVNRVRGGATRTGLAYVTAYDFPEQVRALVDDPAPVKRAQSAILLIDQLDQFAEFLSELESVCRIFLDHNHYVVLASSVPPSRLTNLPAGLQTIVEKGQVIDLVQGSDSEPGSPRTVSGLDADDEDETWPEDSESSLYGEPSAAVGGAKVSAATDTGGPGTASARSELRNAQERITELEAALDTVTVEKESVDGEIRKLREQVTELDAERESVRNERDQLEQSLEQKTSEDQEVTELKTRVAELENLSGKSAAEVQTLLSSKATLEDRVEQLQNELERSRSEGAEARSEANELVRRAEALLAQVEANRVERDKTESQHREEVDHLEARIEELERTAASAEELAAVKTQRDEAMAEAKAALEQVDALRTELETARQDTEIQIAELRSQTQQQIREAGNEHEAVKAERDELAAETGRVERRDRSSHGRTRPGSQRPRSP